jgi:hypothetical protein
MMRGSSLRCEQAAASPRRARMGSSRRVTAQSCARDGLSANLDALKPVPPTTMWLGGGPRLAYVRGQMAGRRVHAWLSLKNGCEIKRWDALGTVLRL